MRGKNEIPASYKAQLALRFLEEAVYELLDKDQPKSTTEIGQLLNINGDEHKNHRGWITASILKGLLAADLIKNQNNISKGKNVWVKL